jgi:hypothetical protein
MKARRSAGGQRVQACRKDTDDLPRLLGTLGYPGFAYLANSNAVANPAAVLMACLRPEQGSARVTEALPWLLVTFADGLDWKWVVDQAKLANLQNRLGFLVDLAQELARRGGDSSAAKRLSEVARQLEEARLAKEDTLGSVLTEAERRFLRHGRPELAAHWNLLTRLGVDNLSYAK